MRGYLSKVVISQEISQQLDFLRAETWSDSMIHKRDSISSLCLNGSHFLFLLFSLFVIFPRIVNIKNSTAFCFIILLSPTSMLNESNLWKNFEDKIIYKISFVFLRINAEQMILIFVNRIERLSNRNFVFTCYDFLLKQQNYFKTRICI